MTSTGSSSSAEATKPAAATVELVVGVATYNDADTIADVAAAIRTGLQDVFAGREARGEASVADSRILLADGASNDGTLQRARDALGPASANLVEVTYPRAAADLLDVAYHGRPARARALRAILEGARDLGVKACVVIDGGIRTVAPGWIAALAGPVIDDGFDYVSPFYARHPYEGALTKGIVYPLFRALYGVRLRQPAVGEFGGSARLVEAYLDDDVWERDGAQIGIDLWLAAGAAAGGYKLCEAPLGRRTYHARAEEALDLGTTLVQVVGALFGDLEGRVDVWQRVRGSIPVPIIGTEPAVALETPQVNVEGLIESFHLGYRELRDIWTWAIPPKSIVELRRLLDVPPQRFRLEDDLWARIVYDFALGYRLRVLPRDHLLRSLTPLYLGWLASMILQVRDLPPQGADARVEQLALAFEAEKPYLVSGWRWPERFRT